MSKKPAHLAVVVALLVAFAAAGDAFAQRGPKGSEGGGGRPTGLRVTVTNVDTGTFDVDFDITLNTVYGSPVPPNAGLLGNYLFTTFSSATGTLLNPVVLAVDYGDGNTISQTTIPGVGGGSYVGSFTHTYPGPGIFPLTVGASGFVGTNALTTGNPVINPSPVPTTGPFGTTGLYVVGSYIAGGTPITYNIIASTPNFAMGVTNTPGTNQPYPPTTGGGLNIPDPFIPPVGPPEIPTASEVGLILLALLLAAGGVVLMRR